MRTPPPPTHRRPPAGSAPPQDRDEELEAYFQSVMEGSEDDFGPAEDEDDGGFLDCPGVNSTTDDRIIIEISSDEE